METNLTLASHVNDVISHFICELPPCFKNISKEWQTQTPNHVSHSCVSDIVRIGRLLGTFEAPSETGAEERASAAFRKLLSDDQRLSEQFPTMYRLGWNAVVGYYKRPITSHKPLIEKCQINTDVIRFRIEVQKLLRGFRINWDLSEFGPGSTFLIDDGRRTPFAKLVRDKLDITRKAIPYFSKIVWKHATWRKIFIRRGYNFLKEWYLEKGHYLKPWWIKKLAKSKHMSPSELLIHVGLGHTLTIVDGERAATVPKNNETDRAIAVPPLLNTYLTKAVGESLKLHLRDNFGIDLYYGQDAHKKAARDMGLATIDFSNASHSVTKPLIDFCCPKWLKKVLFDLRCNNTVFPDGSNRQLICLSQMGTGFTFEMLTVMLAAAQRAVGSFTNLQYGDDAITPVDRAERFMQLCEDLGFKVNRKKSFTTGRLRESCGSFTADGRDIICFDLPWASNDIEAVSNINKVFAYANSDGVFRSRWQKLHKELLKGVPHGLQGPAPLDPYAKVRQTKYDNLASWVWVHDAPSRRSNLTKWFTRLGYENAVWVDSVYFEDVHYKGGYSSFEKSILCKMHVKNGIRPTDIYRGEGKVSQRRMLVSNGHILMAYDTARRERERQKRLERSDLLWYELRTISDSYISTSCVDHLASLVTDAVVSVAHNVA